MTTTQSNCRVKCKRRTCWCYSWVVPALAATAGSAQAAWLFSVHPHCPSQSQTRCLRRPATASPWSVGHRPSEATMAIVRTTLDRMFVGTGCRCLYCRVAGTRGAGVLGQVAHLRFVGPVWLPSILEATNGLVYVLTPIVVQLTVVVKDDDSHLTLAQDRQLHRLLKQAGFALHEGDLTLPAFGDGPDVHLLPAHCNGLHGRGEAKQPISRA